MKRGVSEKARPSAIGTSATAAAIRASSEAVVTAWPPPNDIPQTTIRPASTPSIPRAWATADRQSASWRGIETSRLGSPSLCPQWR